MDNTTFMDAHEVAQRLGLSLKRTQHLIALGYVPSVRRGRRRLIPRAAFAAWEARQAEEALANAKEMPCAS